jgi:FkbH-like protein
VVRINAGIRTLADQCRVNVVAVDQKAQQDGISSWYSPSLWHQSKQEIHPHNAPLYGDLVGRMLAAEQGRSYKCLVLDLDNILWGGVIGDDGLEGIHLGQNSAAGEAYAGFQEYVLRLSRRGIVLAVCSKNDEVNALAPFEEQHPGMVLSRDDIVCFAANWQDKASNLRAIAQFLNFGLDALVFVDDSPYERDRIRRELPMVAVPELPEDPSLYAACLSSAGYFEGLALAAEDYARNRQYKNRVQSELFKAQTDSSASQLENTRISLFASPFDETSISRVVQLINKTNQFNFTTRRYSEDVVRAMMAEAKTVTCQISLADNFGDSGIICIVIGKELEQSELHLDTFLMSCRVLGRQIESAALDIVACQAVSRGLTRLVGYYRPTERNGMVRDLYARLGFTQINEGPDGGSTWELDLNGYQRRSTRPLQGRCNFKNWFEKRAARASTGAGMLQR